MDDTLAGVVPENPVVNVFGTTRFNTNPRMMAVNSAGTMAFMITLSGLSVVSLTPTGTDTRPVINTSAHGIVNSADGTPNFKPGSFITISGTRLADAATAGTIPRPTVLSGSCVTFGDIAVPLPATSSGQIQAPVQDALPTGMQVVEVRSLSTAQDSDPVVMTVKPGNLGRTRSANLWQIVRVGLQHEWFGSYMGRQRNGQSVVCRWPNLTLDRPNEQV